ncbi:uroporphyrinogen-III C-methyltransferase [Glaciecola siphonariae]|uniref:uroporphyrinogen-III C-methyltransferase n=1 Tax=Glaciecola siphonariae TaxID=521012 RepID=A0ABV9LUZ0_9ALTE
MSTKSKPLLTLLSDYWKTATGHWGLYRVRTFFDAKSFARFTTLRENTAPCERKANKGKVLLVGAGPGDPDLLTLKACKALAQADYVLFDWLVSKDILALIPKTSKIECVGKRAGRHSMTQSQICHRMVELALSGKRVVRLKGGDPAIFARTAEETDALMTHNIPFSIIPGISAASGASAYSGIPLTHRDCAQSVRFVTATMRTKTEQPHWQSLAKAINTQTLVFYMGLGRLEMIASELISAGVCCNMPVALIDKATSAQQQICVGTLENIVHKCNQAELDGPTLIVVGRVVDKRADVTLATELMSLASTHGSGAKL